MEQKLISDVAVSFIIMGSIFFGGMANVVYGWLSKKDDQGHYIKFEFRKFISTTITTFFSTLTLGNWIASLDVVFSVNTLILFCATLAGTAFLGMDKLKDGVVGLKNKINGGTK